MDIKNIHKNTDFLKTARDGALHVNIFYFNDFAVSRTDDQLGLVLKRSLRIAEETDDKNG